MEIVLTPIATGQTKMKVDENLILNEPQRFSSKYELVYTVVDERWQSK